MQAISPPAKIIAKNGQSDETGGLHPLLAQDLASKRIDDFVNRQMTALRPAWEMAGNLAQSSNTALSEQIATAFARYHKAYADYLS